MIVGWLQRLCDGLNDSASDDVHIAILNVLLHLSRTVTIANLTPDACKTQLFLFAL